MKSLGPSLAVAVYAIHNQRVLLINHLRLGMWVPVGGSIEPGETPLEAAKRELLEETGLEGSFLDGRNKAGRPRALLEYSEMPDPDKGLRMIFSFVAFVNSHAVKPNGEFREYRWVQSTQGLVCPTNVSEIIRGDYSRALL